MTYRNGEEETLQLTLDRCVQDWDHRFTSGTSFWRLESGGCVGKDVHLVSNFTASVFLSQPKTVTRTTMTTVTGSYTNPTIYSASSSRSRSPGRSSSYSSQTFISSTAKPKPPVANMTSSYYMSTRPFSIGSTSSSHSDSFPQSSVWQNCHSTNSESYSTCPSIDSGTVTFDFSLPSASLVIDKNNVEASYSDQTSNVSKTNKKNSTNWENSSRRFSVGVVTPVKRSSNLQLKLSGDHRQASLDIPPATPSSPVYEDGEDEHIYRSSTEIPLVRRHSVHTDHPMRRSSSTDLRENKYRVYDEDNLVYLLQQCADFPERRKIREALRKLRETKNAKQGVRHAIRSTFEIEPITGHTVTAANPVTVTSSHVTCLTSNTAIPENITPVSTSTPRDVTDVTTPHSDYSHIETDEELRRLLLETEDHLEKRKIRTAIRELKKRVIEEEKRGQAAPEKEDKADCSTRNKHQVSSRPQTGTDSRAPTEPRARPRTTASTATVSGTKTRPAAAPSHTPSTSNSSAAPKKLSHQSREQKPMVVHVSRQENLPGGAKRTVVKAEVTHTSVSHPRGPQTKSSSGTRPLSGSGREVTRTQKGHKAPDPTNKSSSAKESGQRRRKLPDVTAVAAQQQSGKDDKEAFVKSSSTVKSLKPGGNETDVKSSRVDSSTFTRRKTTTKTVLPSTETQGVETLNRPVIPTIIISDETDLHPTKTLLNTTGREQQNSEKREHQSPKKYYRKKVQSASLRKVHNNEEGMEIAVNTDNIPKVMKPVDEPMKIEIENQCQPSQSGKDDLEKAFTDLLDNFETQNGHEVDPPEADILDLNSVEKLNGVSNEQLVKEPRASHDGNLNTCDNSSAESAEKTLTGGSSHSSTSSSTPGIETQENIGTCTKTKDSVGTSDRRGISNIRDSVGIDRSGISNIRDRAVLEKMLSSSRDLDERRQIRTTLRDLKNSPTDTNDNTKLEKSNEEAIVTMDGEVFDDDRLGDVQLEEGEDGAITVTDVQKFDQGQRVVSVTTKKKRTNSEAEYQDRETTVVTTFESPSGTKYEEKDVVKTSRKLTPKGSFYVKKDTVRTKRAFTREGEQTVEEDHEVETDNKSVSLGKCWGDKTLTSMVVNKPNRELTDRSIDTIHEEVDGDMGSGSVSEQVNDRTEPVGSAPEPTITNGGTKEKELFDVNRAKPPGIPDIVSPLKDQQAIEGSTVTLQCQGQAVPEPDALWYAGSTPISETAYFKLKFDGKTAMLTITEVFPDDDGEYRCVFRNSHGVAETRCRLLVKSAHGDEVPAIIKALEDVTVTSGSTVDLQCQVRGLGEVFWFKEGTRIENSAKFQLSLNEGIARLQIQSATSDHSGQYSCSVKNPNGESSSICQLLVTGSLSGIEDEEEVSAPRFLVYPEDQSVSDGEDAIFECCVAGSPRPSVAWYRKGKLLKNSSETPQTYEGQKACLIVKDVFQDDEGTYEFVAQSDEGKSSVEVYLSVKETPSPVKKTEPTVSAPILHTEVQDQTVSDGETAVFVCEVAGSPRPHVTWYWKRNALRDGGQVKQSYDGRTARLELRDVDADDEGLYRCEAENSAGKVSTEGKLVVDVKGCPPDILNPLFNCTATAGKPFKFLCRISGDPPPTVKWYKDGKELQESDLCKPSFEDNIARLELKRVASSDQGLYECTGRNKLGNATTSSQFTVKEESTAAKASIKLNLTSVSKSTADEESQPLKQSLPNHPHQPKSSINSTKDSTYSGPETAVVRSCSPPAVVRSCSPPGVVRSCSPPAVVRSCSPPNAKVYKPDYPGSFPLGNGGSPSPIQTTNSSSPSEHMNNGNDNMSKSSAVSRLQNFFGNLMNNENQSPQRETYQRSPQHDVQVETKQSFVKTKQNGIPLQLSPSQGELSADERSQSSLGSGHGLTTHTINMSSAKIMGIEDEEELHKMLNTTDNFEDRKMIRARLKELREKARDEWERGRKEREAAVVDVVKLRQQKADEDKKKRMQTFQTRAETAGKDSESTYLTQTQKDLKDRHRVADDEKQKRLESYKQIAKTGSGVTETKVTTTKQTTGDHVANNLADKLQQVTSPYTSGKITVRTESWNSQDGVTQKSETTQRWGAPANKPAGARGAMAAFKTMDAANPGAAKPNALVTVSLAKKAATTMRRNAVTIKAEILDFCKCNTEEYQNVQITNFSSSWNNGMAFCAVIHHFYPDAFDFTTLDPKQRRKNFELAFDTAEKMADIAPLLDVDDMVKMKNPDWKCVFCYVQSLYRHLRNHEANKQIAPTQ